MRNNISHTHYWKYINPILFPSRIGVLDGLLTVERTEGKSERSRCSKNCREGKGVEGREYTGTSKKRILGSDQRVREIIR
jgi:hypothetical protein